MQDAAVVRRTIGQTFVREASKENALYSRAATPQCYMNIASKILQQISFPIAGEADS